MKLNDLTSIMDNLSIRMLVMILASLGAVAIIIIGTSSFVMLSLAKSDQSSLIDLSSTQSAAVELESAVMLMGARQGQGLAATTLVKLRDLKNKENLERQFTTAIANLRKSSNDNENTLKLIDTLEKEFTQYNANDEELFRAAETLLETEQQIQSTISGQLADTLTVLDNEIGSLMGKLNLSTNRTNRRVKRLLRNKDQILSNRSRGNDFIEKVEAAMLGEEATLRGMVEDIQFDSLRLNSYMHQIKSIRNMDALLSIKQNQVAQRIDSVTSEVDKLTSRISEDDKLRPTVDKINTSLRDMIAIAFTNDDSVYFLQQRHIELANELATIRNTANAFEIQINTDLDSLLAALAETKVAVTEASASRIAASNTITVLMTLIIVGVLAVLAWYIAKSIQNSLSKVGDALYDIAQGEGDLTQRLEEKGLSETVEIAKAFNQFIETISGTIKHVDSAISSLIESSKLLDELSTKAQDSISYQQKQNSLAADAMGELSGAANNIAQNAEDAMVQSQKVSDESSKGNKVTKSVAEEITNLASHIENTSSAVKTMEQYSVEIGGVIDVIKGIADQTNLLALNAAIEAARAGEQGRGFAVVADEVRSLAGRTQESTVEIENMIKQLQSGADEVVKAIEEGNVTAKHAADLSNEASESLNLITQTILSISQMNTAIASEANNQSEVSNEMNINFTQIKTIGESTSAMTNQIAESGRELSAMSDSLAAQMKRFKLE